MSGMSIEEDEDTAGEKPEVSPDQMERLSSNPLKAVTLDQLIKPISLSLGLSAMTRRTKSFGKV